MTPNGTNINESHRQTTLKLGDSNRKVEESKDVRVRSESSPKFLCLQVCAKIFGNASALAKHKLTHSDERKYVCNMCGKAFKRQDHL